MSGGKRLAVAITIALIAIVSACASVSAALSPATVQIGASGTGMIELRGELDVQLEAHHPVLLVHDDAGDGTITAPVNPGDVDFLGFRVYFSAQDAHITGSDVSVVVLGDGITVHGTGHGWLYAKGTGTYTVGAMTATQWRPEGSVAAIARWTPNSGVYVAHGAGFVAVRGTMTYEAGLRAGVLLVKDVAGNAKVNVTGGLAGDFLGFKAYPGATSATVTGSDVAVIAVGADINLTATGAGWAYAQGFGVYSLNRAPSEDWDLSGRFTGIAR